MTRAALYAAFVAAVEGLALAPVEEWAGDPADFNPAAALPSLAVAWLADEAGGAEGIGNHIGWERTAFLGVYVSATGTAQALGLLDSLEQGLAGPLSGTDRQLERAGKVEPVAAPHGRPCFLIAFAATDSFLKTW